MNTKKILKIFILVAVLLNTMCCMVSYAAQGSKAAERAAKAEIERLKWLENVEKGKLYKNQQKLETATTNLQQSKSQIITLQKELDSMQGKLNKASSEYNTLNSILAEHIRKVFKTQRAAFFEMLIASEDVNMLVDRIYFQKIILHDDYDKMATAKKKAQEMRLLEYSIRAKKENLERNIASINTQQTYIKRAIAKNENMIEKLKTDRVAYQRAQKELADQSASLTSYISRTTKKDNTTLASVGFIKPIQGRITSPFGWRTHPIFNTRSFHSGIDIGGPNYGEIHASNAGKVIYSGWYGGYGKVVIVEHGMVNGKPTSTLYAHMSTIKVANGQQVTKGQVLGYEGTTGYSTGPHCHFEVRVNGQPNNPMNYI